MQRIIGRENSKCAKALRQKGTTIRRPLGLEPGEGGEE